MLKFVFPVLWLISSWWERLYALVLIKIAAFSCAAHFTWIYKFHLQRQTFHLWIIYTQWPQSSAGEKVSVACVKVAPSWTCSLCKGNYFTSVSCICFRSSGCLEQDRRGEESHPPSGHQGSIADGIYRQLSLLGLQVCLHQTSLHNQCYNQQSGHILQIEALRCRRQEFCSHRGKNFSHNHQSVDSSNRSKLLVAGRLLYLDIIYAFSMCIITQFPSFLPIFYVYC